MGPKQIRLIQVLVVVIAIGTVIGAYLMLNQSGQENEPTISVTGWGCKILDSPIGSYVDEGGQVVLDTWEGQESRLMTIWNSEHGAKGDAMIILCHIEFQADSSTTISADRISLHPDSAAWGTTYGIVDSYISYEGLKLHNSESDMTVTTDASGHARMELIIIDDAIHNVLYFDGQPLRSST